MARKFFVGGNWKANGTTKQAQELVEKLNKADLPSSVEVVVAPAFIHIPMVQSNLRKEIALSAQNCWVKGNGAYTGEVTADMLEDIKVPWVILGHSERRSLLKESEEFVAEKTEYALSKDLKVILCVGETLEQRESNQTFDVISKQVKPVASKVKDWSNIVVAYEPVWAIGTGKVATKEQAQEVHQQLRDWLKDNVSPEVSQETRIIYGGSVSAKNSDELATQPDVDGFLVGGASLKPEFVDVVKSGEKSK